jgi:gliding motility-associated-like protein
MITRKLLLVFCFLFIFNGIKNLKAQNTPHPIILNEYCVSNVPNGYADERGVLNDYVELYCAHTASISLSGFYLSNDRNNLLKWRFPGNFPALQPGSYGLVWLSGKNTNDGVNFHANFSIEQCKNQWIILSSGSGTIYDSIFIQPTKAGHVRGRVDRENRGIGAWRLFETKSPRFDNGAPTALGYAPTPKIHLTTDIAATATTATGGFMGEEPQIAYIKLEGQTYDSAYSCYDVFYTKNGDYPVPFYNGGDQFGNYYKYPDSLFGITIERTMVIRAIAVPKPNKGSVCGPPNRLPSFCETNTYFISMEHNSFTPEFGVISIAMDKADTSWFSSQGTVPTSVHVEYYDKKEQVSEGYAMINRPPQEEWRTAQKGFYISIDDRMGYGCNFEGDIFNVKELGTTERRVFPALHLKGGDFESHSVNTSASGPGANISYGTGIRDMVMQSLAAKYKLNVSPLHVKPVVAFVNGNYWGVYDLREIYDKYYEQFYNGQSPDSLDLNFVHNCQEGSVSYWDGSTSRFGANFNSTVYNVVRQGPVRASSVYNRIMNSLDKASFIDYMILNSYAMNSDLVGANNAVWCNNVALAKGGQPNKPGGKWHFYLWNMPAIFNFTAIVPTGAPFANYAVPPCYLYNSLTSNYTYEPTLNKYNGHGNIMTSLMNAVQGNPAFQLEYKNRYQDLLNGPLRCENILKHFDYIAGLYQKEMMYHEDPATAPFPGKFPTTDPNFIWDTNAAVLRKVIELRCNFFLDDAFKGRNCYDMTGPFALNVDVKPSGAGQVKVNSILLENYPWTGMYFQTQMSFKAIPANNTDYIFHHWEISGPISTDPLSKDSIGLNFNTGGNIVAVFTDKRTDLDYRGEAANVPTGFTPNGDGLNDEFRPLGSAEFTSDYQMTIFNRWGQQVFRSVDPLVGWDGRYKGQEAQTGVYAYFITYKNIYNEEKMLKGNVTLTR